MANPYANNDMDPFAEDFRRAPPPAASQPQWTAPVPAQNPPAPGAATGADAQFYNPSGNAAYQPSATYSPPPMAPVPGLATAPQAGAAAAPAAAAPQVAIDPNARSLATTKFWTLAFYQQMFDVDTKQVLLRMSNTLVPLNPPDFLMDRNWHGGSGGALGILSETDPNAFQEAGVVLNRSPDLYGPFWITTTLWMTLAIVSNIMSKIAFERQQQNVVNGTQAPVQQWSYNFKMASVACVTMYVYCFGMGAIVWGLMKWKSLPVSYLDAICLYGYSMFIFLLVAILCMIPVNGLQWLFVLAGGCWSSLYLLINFWHVWKVALERAWFIGVVVLVAGMHMLITMSFKFYFMNYDL